MIRREPAAPDADGAQWILISQVEHARLSGALADHWGAAPVVPLVDRDELLWAIVHHDDGWAAWERSPGVEPDHARPRSFTEMPLDEGLEIWTASITGAAEHGPLAGYTVAGHFCELLRRYDTGWKHDAEKTAQAERFLATFDRLQEACFTAWQARSPSKNTPELAGRALAQLQLFDVLSLWFCCDEATTADEFETPAGPPIALSPTGSAARGEPMAVRLSPWPLTVPALNLEVRGRAVPVRRYESREELAAVPLQTVQLRWRLGKS